MLYVFVLYRPAKPALRGHFIIGFLRLRSLSSPSLNPGLVPPHIITLMVIKCVVCFQTIVHASRQRSLGYYRRCSFFTAKLIEPPNDALEPHGTEVAAYCNPRRPTSSREVTPKYDNHYMFKGRHDETERVMTTTMTRCNRQATRTSRNTAPRRTQNRKPLRRAYSYPSPAFT